MHYSSTYRSLETMIDEMEEQLEPLTQLFFLLEAHSLLNCTSVAL